MMKRFMKVAFCALAAFVGVSFADCAANTAGTYGAITVSADKNGKCVAVIDGDSAASTTISNVTVDSVIYKRTFNGSFSTMDNPAQTIVLPFASKDECVSGAKFYTFSSVTDSYNIATNGTSTLEWVALAHDIGSSSAGYGENKSNHEIWNNTPYLIRLTSHHTNDFDTLYFKSGCLQNGYVLNSSSNTTVSFKQDEVKAPSKDSLLLNAGTWNFIGTYAKKSFTLSDEGSVYGFAAKNKDTTVSVGQFVKAGAKAYIKPFRAYLTFTAKTAATKRVLL